MFIKNKMYVRNIQLKESLHSKPKLFTYMKFRDKVKLKIGLHIAKIGEQINVRPI